MKTIIMQHTFMKPRVTFSVKKSQSTTEATTTYTETAEGKYYIVSN